MIRKVKIEVSENGEVDVKIEGGNLNKRELLRIIKAIKIGHRRSIAEYRKNRMFTKIKEKENGQNRRTEISGSEVGERKAGETVSIPNAGANR